MPPFRIWILATALALASDLSAGEDFVPFQPELPAGAAIQVDVRLVHPTQFSLGWREVVAKRIRFDAMTPEQVTLYLIKKDVPVVVGPDGQAYLIDGHHTLRALLESGHRSKIAFGHIIANWSDLDEVTFWQRMRDHNYTYLSDSQGRPDQPPAALPSHLAVMQRDPYRGLAWAVMEAGAFRELKGVYFQEFRWADFFRKRIPVWDDDDETEFQQVLARACAIAHDSEAAPLPGYRAESGTLPTQTLSGHGHPARSEP